jgi:hypothetical protein
LKNQAIDVAEALGMDQFFSSANSISVAFQNQNLFK